CLRQFPLWYRYQCNYFPSFSLIVVTWLTALIAVHATIAYSAIVITIAGKATGAARMEPAATATTSAMFLSFLKKGGVGVVARATTERFLFSDFFIREIFYGKKNSFVFMQSWINQRNKFIK